MTNSIIDHINSTKNNITQFAILNNLKTGNPIFDTIFTSIILTIVSFFVSCLYDYKSINFFYNFSLDDVNSLFYKKNTIVLEGRRSYMVSSYTHICTISEAYSDRFKAVWYYIINNIDKNDSIFKIKETHTNYQSHAKNKYDSIKKKLGYFYGFSK
jgi:hypothetical protein